MSNPTRMLKNLSVALVLGVPLFHLPLSQAHADGPPQKGANSSHAMDHSQMMGMEGMKGSESMSMTGNADYDFAVNMRHHHSMALEMARSEIKDGKDPEMDEMAKGIVASQTKEIAAFDRWLAKQPKPRDAMKPK